MSNNVPQSMLCRGLLLPNGKFNPAFERVWRKDPDPLEREWYESALGSTLGEKVYLAINQLSERPVCLGCGGPVKFISFGEGYREACSRSCQGKIGPARARATNLERYGYASPAQRPEVLKKMRETTKERIGVDNAFKDVSRVREGVRRKYGDDVSHVMQVESVKQKQRESLRSSFGVDYPMQSPSVRKRTQETNIERYGVATPLHADCIKKKVQEKKIRKFWETITKSPRMKGLVTPNFDSSDYSGGVGLDGKPVLYPWRCAKCNGVFQDHLANGRIPRCPTCFPPTCVGVEEKEFVTWLTSELPPGMQVVTNTRRVIPPLELDVYLPDLNLAIEFDEVYWHGQDITGGQRGRDYHIGKTRDCASRGIRLIHVWDSEWRTKTDIVKSVIREALGITGSVVYARSCLVTPLTSSTAKSFLEDNHLQGYAPASIRYGLVDPSGELCACLMIGKNRYAHGTYEVVRYVNRRGTRVTGGLSRLWASAMKEIPRPFTLVSYVDLRWFTGESNTSGLGLTFIRDNPPGLSYAKGGHIINRQNLQKHMLKKKLGDAFDPTLTEWENLQLAGYDRVWDCGTRVYSRFFPGDTGAHPPYDVMNTPDPDHARGFSSTD